jgi:transcriptional regulator with GAF, ATPase, and Fis domain
MLAVMATSKTKATATKAPPAERPVRSLTEIGRAASHEAQRKALLAELRRQRWNMSATARALSMTDTANVLRSIRALGLKAEYDAAKAAGKITPGGRTA